MLAAFNCFEWSEKVITYTRSEIKITPQYCANFMQYKRNIHENEATQIGPSSPDHTQLDIYLPFDKDLPLVV